MAQNASPSIFHVSPVPALRSAKSGNREPAAPNARRLLFHYIAFLFKLQLFRLIFMKKHNFYGLLLFILPKAAGKKPEAALQDLHPDRFFPFLYSIPSLHSV